MASNIPDDEMENGIRLEVELKSRRRVDIRQVRSIEL